MSDMDERENDLERVLRETPWSAIVIPLILAVMLCVAVIVIVTVG